VYFTLFKDAVSLCDASTHTLFAGTRSRLNENYCQFFDTLSNQLLFMVASRGWLRWKDGGGGGGGAGRRCTLGMLYVGRGDFMTIHMN
jgi:hypothetical protein